MLPFFGFVVCSGSADDIALGMTTGFGQLENICWKWIFLLIGGNYDSGGCYMNYGYGVSCW